MKTDHDELLKIGLGIGTKVSLTKRTTIEFDVSKLSKKRKTFRKDAQVGDQSWVQGVACVNKQYRPLCEFACDFDGHEVKALVAMKPSSLKVGSLEVKKGAKETTAASSQVLKGFEFLGTSDKPTEVVKHWKGKLTSADVKSEHSYIHSYIGHALRSVTCAVPTFTEDDLHIIIRGGKTEVWTARPFKKGELVLAPCSTEYKDRYWTYNKAAIVSDSEKFSANSALAGKQIVIDGRLRHNVGAKEGARSFALFWIIERTDVMTNVNLDLDVVTVDVKSTFTLPHTSTPSQVVPWNAAPGIPVLCNPKPLKKHVRLYAREDVAAKKLQSKVEKQIFADKLKQEEDAKKKAKEAKDAKVKSEPARGGK